MEVKIDQDQIALSKSFPFDMDDTVGVHAYFNRLHWHNILEINYVKSGEGTYLINGITYPLQAGDIVLINSNDLHRAFETKDLILQVITFDPILLVSEQRYDNDIMAPFVEMGSRFDNLLDRNHPKVGELREILADMQKEFNMQAASYKSMIRSQLARFLAYINRHFSKTDVKIGIDYRKKQAMIQSVLTAIEEELERSWTLQEMADLIHLSPSRFSAIFREMVGMSPTHYLLALRLDKAILLLETTDRKIIDVAEECGFHNLSNFNRLFLKHAGRTPRQVRDLQ